MADSYNNSNKAYRRNLMIHSTIRLIVCILLTIICLLPIYVILINSTRASSDIIESGISFLPGADFFNNFSKLNDPTIENGVYTKTYNVLIGYRNSLIISGCSTILTVFFSALTAYGLTVYDFKLKKFATGFILAIMMIPMQVVSTGFLEFMAEIKLLDNYLPLILPAIAAPAVVFFMLQYMKSSFPLDIVEAARIDGCGEFRTFMQISLPIFKPAFAVQAIFAFVTSWNNYYTPSMLLVDGDLNKKTMPMMVSAILSNDKLTDYGVRYLTVLLSILPVVIIYLALSKFIVKGVALGAVKG